MRNIFKNRWLFFFFGLSAGVVLTLLLFKYNEDKNSQKTYESPAEIVLKPEKPDIEKPIVKKKKKKYAGQRQKYFFVKFDGEEKDLNPEKHGEFSKLKWVTPSEVIQNSWEIKKPIYEKVFAEFGLTT